MTWQYGRNLITVGDNITYAYNADGLRISKSGARNTNYYIVGGKYIGEVTTIGGTQYVIAYVYDETDSVIGIIVNGSAYYFAKNLQGDVLAILNYQGNVIARYTYDIWGKLIAVKNGDVAITSNTHVAHLNPFRYRGYMYDKETGFYYLRSRYYDPEVGRFLNADGLVSTGQGLSGFNMFAYCNNNPVMFVDDNGNCPVLALIVTAVVCVVALISYSKQSTSDPVSPEEITDSSTTAPTLSYNDYLNALGERESTNDYTKVNQFGYLGRYQMGEVALQDAGFKDSSGNWTHLANSYGVYSSADFLNLPEAQEVAITAFNKKQCDYIKNYGLDSYIGTEYCGVIVTQSGLLAACHLVGVGTMKAALTNGTIAWDGNGVHASEYMKMFSGYDVSEVW